MLIDDRDNIFVRTYEKSKDGGIYYDYFDSNGKFLAKFPLKINIFVVHRDCFYALETNEEGLEIIARYKYSLKIK